ncbi:hypothetical protein FOCC_FOCC008912 [Frankliniella occidentalis]|nr:hypothetical protein FOCC_FOCC008912 [Frankliniella occidentalis]
MSFFINVRMIDFSPEMNLWGLKWIFSREIYFNPECSFIVWWIILQNQRNLKSKFVNYLHESTLTGTITPCHRSKFDSSTWTSLKALRPEARMSPSS